jgi:hypothetical protein
MPDTVKYIMGYRGTHRGDVTGVPHRFREGEEVQAPEGEFRSLPSSFYETRPMEAEAGEATPTPVDGPYSLGEHLGGGWYSVRRDGEVVRVDNGEPVTFGQGKDEAVRTINDLNREEKE